MALSGLLIGGKAALGALWRVAKGVDFEFWLYAGLAIVIGTLAFKTIHDFHALRAENLALKNAQLVAEAGWKAQIGTLSVTMAQDAETLEKGHKDEVEALHSGYGLIVDELSARAAHRPVAAKPAASAPVECRAYEATPDMLPVRDERLLAAVGLAADVVVRQRNLAVREYQTVMERINAYAALGDIAGDVIVELRAGLGTRAGSLWESTELRVGPGEREQPRGAGERREWDESGEL